ncbi:hypothetical protein [Mycolicibacterium pulveris]|uniref:hypothetical protein n=1 Tax=Mycolicibacterium pulveris TaxID=36813 RepID=UPI003CF2FABF
MFAGIYRPVLKRSKIARAAKCCVTQRLYGLHTFALGFLVLPQLPSSGWTSKGDAMHVAVRSTVTTGVALIGAGVIAVSPVTPPVPEIAATPIYSPQVALTATYAELFDNTLSNLGYLANDLFEEGVAPILQQVVVNQLTMVQDLGAAVHRLFEASNPAGIPATFNRAIDQLMAGQIQEAAEILSTGVILAALPLLPPLQAPINNLVAVIDLIPQVIPMVGIGLISPPLALFQATAEAVQDIVNAVGAGDFTGVVNAFVNAPATILDGVINGYPDNGFPGLIGANGGALGILVNIRDMIVEAITPAETGAAAEDEEAETAAVAATTTSPALTVNLDVAPASTVVDAQPAATGSGDEGDLTPVTDVVDDAEDEEAAEEAEEEEVVETPIDEETEAEDAAAEEDAESDNGGTDLSDGNKVTPGGTADDDSDTESVDSGDAEESDAAADADTDSDSGDGSDSSSDSE